MSAFITLKGQVISGHGVASGRSTSSPYPQGSIAMQAPFFKALGLDLSGFFLGTLNLSIAPKAWKLLQAHHRFERLEWTHLHPPETFSFVRCGLRAATDPTWTSAWLYYPHPETKTMHLQGAHIMEVIALRMDACTVGSCLQLRLDSQYIHVV